MTLIELLIALVILGLILWAVEQLPLPPPFPIIVRIIFVIILILILVQFLGVSGGPIVLRR
jgi:prepilin-type N-terminal cleavage/methylation domain-containing protein